MPDGEFNSESSCASSHGDSAQPVFSYDLSPPTGLKCSFLLYIFFPATCPNTITFLWSPIAVTVLKLETQDALRS